MGKHAYLFSLFIGVFLVLDCGVAQMYNTHQQQQGECQIEKLNSLEPTDQVQAEGGRTEFWNSDDRQFQCAGVAIIRHIIQSNGLLLPSYTNAPLLAYVVRGKGYQGIILPGCPETFQSSQESEEQGSRKLQDRHQKIRHFSQGDVIAIPAGAAHWMYNDGNSELVLVVLLDTSNNVNQLDRNPRRFFIAGNPQRQQQQEQGSRGQQNAGNIFRGLDVKSLAEAFRVDEETARKLKGEDDQRGHIIKVNGELHVVKPPMGSREEQQREQGEEQQREQGGQGNGFEETMCNMRLTENIDDPSRADIFNPRAGRLSTLNSHNLPILRFFQLGAERGILYKNGIVAPHWNLNAHCVVYATRGEARIQIVDQRGQAVFNDRVRAGQLVVIPQSFAVAKQAGNQGFEWIGFKTNDNAMISTLAGRTSAIRGLPIDVISAGYQISKELARRLKYNRDGTLMFESESGSRSDRIAFA